MNPVQVTKNDYNITIEKDGSHINVSWSIDNDIWFSSNEELVMIPIYYSSREMPLFNLLNSLMQSIVGKYVLDDEYKQDSLPHDFVDLDNKIITWHSDNDNNSSLELMYENNAIVLCLKGDPKKSTTVRIRTNGSEYYTYYQFFEKFFRELLGIAKSNEPAPPSDTTPKERIRKKGIRNWF